MLNQFSRTAVLGLICSGLALQDNLFAGTASQVRGRVHAAPRVAPVERPAPSLRGLAVPTRPNTDAAPHATPFQSVEIGRGAARLARPKSDASGKLVPARVLNVGRGGASLERPKRDASDKLAPARSGGQALEPARGGTTLTRPKDDASGHLAPVRTRTAERGASQLVRPKRDAGSHLLPRADGRTPTLGDATLDERRLAADDRLLAPTRDGAGAGTHLGGAQGTGQKAGSLSGK